MTEPPLRRRSPVDQALAALFAAAVVVTLAVTAFLFGRARSDATVTSDPVPTTSPIAVELPTTATTARRAHVATTDTTEPAASSDTVVTSTTAAPAPLLTVPPTTAANTTQTTRTTAPPPPSTADTTP